MHHQLLELATCKELQIARLTPVLGQFIIVIPLSVGDSLIVQVCRRTISLIQIGANGEVQPLETG